MKTKYFHNFKRRLTTNTKFLLASERNQFIILRVEAIKCPITPNVINLKTIIILLTMILAYYIP